MVLTATAAGGRSDICPFQPLTRNSGPVYVGQMLLAGVPVPDRLVLQLAGHLRAAGSHSIATRLEHACDTHVKLFALLIAERRSILAVLADCPPGLGELRAVLLQEHAWRAREGLA